MCEKGVGRRCNRLSGGVQPDEDSGKRFKVFGVEDIACHLHGVGLNAGGEDVGEVAERVALVIVLDGIGKVDGIGGVWLQRVKDFDLDALSGSGDVGHLMLRR